MRLEEREVIYDLIILGAGPGGYLAAERAGQAGMKVLCIEKEHIGGVCLNEGCIPTKTILYSAKLYEGADHGEKYGVKARQLEIDHAAVIARKNRVIQQLVSGVKTGLRSSGVETIAGAGEIRGRVDGLFQVYVNGEIKEGRRLLLATGSVPVLPPILGLREHLESGLVVTNRELLSRTELPRHLAVIGGGVIGLEMASYYTAVGCEVTIIEMMDHIAGEQDAELVSVLQRTYEKKGMNFLLGAKVVEVTDNGVVYEQNGRRNTLEADTVLCSIGRRARTEGTGIENIGIITKHGAIVTDEHLRTNVPEVYAVGDCNGKMMLAHTAYREAEVAVNMMLGKEDRMRYHAIPTILYTNPELSAVGETEASAKAKGLDIQVVKLPMAYSGRYLAENEENTGMFKLIVDRESWTIVGAHALCNYSSEFMVALAIFIETEMPLHEIKEVVFPHPSVSEIVREAVFQTKI